LDIEKIYDRYFDEIFNYILKRVLNVALAEDLAGVVFMKVVDKIDTYDPDKASVRTWIYSITNNELIDYYRRKRIKKPYDDLKPFLKDEDVLKEIQKKQDKLQKNKLYKDILAILDKKLSMEERDIIIMHYIEGMKYKEISEIKDLNENTLRSKAHRALKKVKNLIDLEKRGLK
jgi:RNA polymerase sigma-70 factor (ECF subfamily)